MFHEVKGLHRQTIFWYGLPVRVWPIFCFRRWSIVELRIAALTIIVEQPDSVQALNTTLHTFSQFIIGRFGLPYRERGVNIICVVLEAPQDQINALTGKIGRLPGVTAKATYSNIITKLEDES